MSSNTIFHTLNSNNLPVDLIEVYDSSNATTNTIVTKFVTSSGQDLGSIFTLYDNLSSINKIGEQGAPCKYYLSNGTDVGTLFVKKNTVVSAGPVLFTATTFPELAFWFDAYNATGVTKDTNNKVSSFNDKSGNNRNMIQPTAAYQPTFSATAVNGKPGISFTNVKNVTLNNLYGDSNAQAFQLTSLTNNINKSIAIFGVTSGNGNKFGRGGVYNNNIIIFTSNSTTAIYGLAHGTNTNYFTVTTTDSSYRLESYISNRSNGTSSVKKNGVLFGSKTYNPDNINNIIDSLGNQEYTINENKIYMGAYGTLSTPSISSVNALYLNGTVCEILVYTSDTGSEFTEDFRDKIDGYLAWKWGLNGNLPADHPYKNVASFTYS